MIIDQSVSVTFPSGTTIAGKFQPQPGLTAVVGPNEIGKTFRTIETTRYLLFGKKALRGAASDYKNLTAKGTYEIKGSRYTIERSPKQEKLTDASGAVLAVGADAVTKKAEELLGYGLAVFDICNASVQKKAAQLGEMRPAERKRLIDRVVGLTSNEAVEKACRGESQGLKREAEALTRNLRVPTKPQKPVPYTPAEKLHAILTEQRQLKAQYEAMERLIKPLPVLHKPENPLPSSEEIAELEAHQETFDLVEMKRGALQSVIGRAPEQSVPYTHLELNAARDRLALMNAVTCPKCATNFIPGHDELHLPDGPDLTIAQIQTYERQLNAELEAAAARAELEKFPLPEDKSDRLFQLLADQRDWAHYVRQQAAQETQIAANAHAEYALSGMAKPLSQEDLDELQTRLTTAIVYESHLEAYEQQRAEYQRLTEEIQNKQKLADEFAKGGEALADARAMLKANLAPKLSRVASALMVDMTHGKHTDITVDEDMEITVSGQRIETLSGGAETVANIALRIALGRVLVGATFPVFLGDEMDSDTDNVRREAVLEALSALKQHLSQIILITHRGADVADHVIDLQDTP